MDKWVFITGGAKRIGKAIAVSLHKAGYKIALHYNDSSQEAMTLSQTLNKSKPQSCRLYSADLASLAQTTELACQLEKELPGLTILINNASVFAPNPHPLDAKSVERTLTVNLMAPYLLANLLAPQLSRNGGNIVNLIDIHADRPLKHHGLYSISKAALKMATMSLAQDLGPNLRVNGISPGAILWPTDANQSGISSVTQEIPLRRCGDVGDIAATIRFIIDNPYINGQVIAIDGGRSATGYQGADG